MKKGLFVRLSDEELEILRKYCLEVERTQSDVIRDFVRRLKKKLPPSSGKLSQQISVPSIHERTSSTAEEE